MSLWQTLLLIPLVWVQWGFGNGVYGHYEEMASDIFFVFFYYPEGPDQALYLRGTIPYHTPWPGLRGRGCTAAKRVIDQAARLALTAQAGERVILGKMMRGYFWFTRGGGEGDIDRWGVVRCLTRLANDNGGP